MDTLHWALTAITTIFGGTSFITMVIFRKQTRRLKDAEVSEKEVSTLRSVVETLKTQMDWMNDRITSLQSMITNKDSIIEQLNIDKNTLEIKNAKNKGAINKALSCIYCSTQSLCPVLVQRKVHEDEYLHTIASKHVDSDSTEDGNR